jgi:hypothetical protein
VDGEEEGRFVMGGLLMAAVVAAVVVAGGGDEGERWYPPPSGSPCWGEYTTCQLAVYDSLQRGWITSEEMIQMLGDCKRELGWCALVRWLREVMGMDEAGAVAFVAMVGPESVDGMIGLFVNK